MKFRHAMCNEAFEHTPFAESCRTLRAVGYTGIEIAPFTLIEDPRDFTAAQRRDCRQTITDEGLHFVGLHWIMMSPKGLHATTPDAALRARSWDHVARLIDLCADLGDDGVIVFGSPKQRSSTGGMSAADATRHYIDGFAKLAPRAIERGVTLLVEPLSPGQSDVVTSLDEAAAIVKEIDSPGVRTMFDVHNAVDETEDHCALIEKHFPLIRHVHVNEMDGRAPGTGDYDFRRLLETLARLNYQHWVSLEVFDFKPSPSAVAESSLRFLESESL